MPYKNPDDQKAWFKANPEARRQINKCYDNSEKGRQTKKRFVEEHPNYWRKGYEKYKEFLASIKLYNGCQNPHCQWDGPYAPSQLDFHHIEEKSFNIGNQRRAYEKINVEVKKCTVLCANCHRMITWSGLDAIDFPRCKLPPE
jgi:hypothetical protein